MMLREIIRWTTGIDMVEALERATADRDMARADAHAFWTQRDAARDQVVELTAELETLRRTNALHRSLIGILRDVNRNLDERNTFLEQLHGMTPSERLAAVENDAPDRCTKSPATVVDAREAARRLEGWQGHGTDRWGLGVAIDLVHLEKRVAALEFLP